MDLLIVDDEPGIREGLALRWSFMGPFETIDLNAPGGVRDYVDRYQSIYSNIFPQMLRRVDWGGEVLGTVEADRRRAVPREKLVDRQVWRGPPPVGRAPRQKKKDEGVGKKKRAPPHPAG